MNARNRPVGSAVSPGTAPVPLGVITTAAIAGLFFTWLGATGQVGRPGGTAARPATASHRSAHPALATPPGDEGAQAAATAVLVRAAAAAHAVAYHGVAVLAWCGSRGTRTSVAEIWHQPGGQALTRTVVAVPESAHRVSRAAVTGRATPGAAAAGTGMLTMTRRLAALLGANYALAVSGEGSVAGRPARIVTARRHGGSLAARFWLDRATDLPLRRQTFTMSSALMSDVSFVQLAVGPGAAAVMPAPGARSWPHTLASPQLARLRERGWPLPGPLPGHLRLLNAKMNDTPAGPVVDLDYSDGLSVVSVFVQRGHLPDRLTGWSQVALEGEQVYTDDPDDLSVAWSAGGYVYTLISAAPPRTVGEVVAALPHDGGPGVLARIQRGLHRLFSWAGH